MNLAHSRNGNHPKINTEIVPYFLAHKSVRSMTSFHHAFHHKLTIKTPCPATVFLKNPCKNSKTSKPPPPRKIRASFLETDTNLRCLRP